LQPDNSDAYSERSVVLRKLGQLNGALESCEKAIALRPLFAEAFYNKGNIFRELDRLDEACESFWHAIAIKPDFAGAYNNIGLSLRELGRIDEAQDAFRKALDIEPRNVSALFNLSHSKKFEAGEPDLDFMRELSAEQDLLSTDERVELNFALGKAYADLKDHRRSFEHLLAANQTKRAIFPYDEQGSISAFNLLERIFSHELIKSKSGYGDPSRQPIFIVGMPRSGTTLVEQILASHSKVYGAGESEALRRTAHVMYRADGTKIHYPNYMPGLDLADLAKLGAHYLTAINEGRPSSERITDKMPANFLFVGLIHLILPNAKIIHTMRDPIDNCISCFSILFTNGQEFTYDLGELGRYYRRYERLMAHWHSVLPQNKILDVQYEDVVADLETEARRILAFCELPWDDRCLSFHETERPVRTASMTQVRQPIYSRAVGRWRVYEEFLGPLLEALGKKGTFIAPA
jgi:tetratricopeptide (TPR) repeat protein